MGEILCLPKKSNSLKEEKLRKPSFMDKSDIAAFFKKSNSKVIQDDKDHFFQEQAWFQEIFSLNGNQSFIDIHKFLEHYKHYKIDQVSFFSFK